MRTKIMVLIGIFAVMAWGGLALAADSMKTLSSLIPAEQAFLKGFNDYATALVDTIDRLHLIAKRCCQKSERIHKYSFREYRKDVDDYDVSVERYTSFGDRLNFLFRSL